METDNFSRLAVHDPRFKLLSGLPRPDFMVVGGAKCGTTSLSSYLGHHPQIEPVQFKEPNYWTWRLLDREKYQRLFINKRYGTQSPRIAGDYSTSYLLHPMAPRRIRARLPETKIIILLRDPTDRAYSHYIMQHRQGVEGQRSFHDIVSREIEECEALLTAHRQAFLDPDPRTKTHRSDSNGQPLRVARHDRQASSLVLESEEALFQFYVTSYVFRSIYCDQVHRWLSMFAREQVLIIQAEKFFAAKEENLKTITEFLGVDSGFFSPAQLDYSLGGGASNLVESPGDYEPIGEDTRKMLDGFFRPHNEKLFSLLGFEYDWREP